MLKFIVIITIKEVGLYKYINHQAGTTKKASTRFILVQMYNIFRLLIVVPDYSSK